MSVQPIQLSLFSNKINSLCEEMGALLQRAAFSPNIRDRLDFSCALFDEQGKLCAQAAHIPVHLGSMAYAMQAIVDRFVWQEGDVVIFNDPYLGGTHLPDVTLVMPVFIEEHCIGFVANRAHHADIGADEPGSMPLSSHIEQEGVLLSPQYLGHDGMIDNALFTQMFAKVEQQESLYADISAQLGANLHGIKRLQHVVTHLGLEKYHRLVTALFAYSRELAEAQINELADGTYTYTDYMDDDGLGNTDIPIKVKIDIKNNQVTVDFEGTSAQVQGNINCPKAVTAAAVYYVFRCLMSDDIPACAGAWQPITIHTPGASLLDCAYPGAVAAGNVETSSRIVDVLFAALAPACDRIPACSQGSMNNIAMGANDQPSWSYYETMGGGAGANQFFAGMSALQTHMTNTKNTPIEVLEMNYPLRISQYAIRKNSGGVGKQRGGDGLIREFEFLKSARVTILSERRRHAPAGLQGGASGKPGKNFLNDREIAAKTAFAVQAGDRVRIETPGGGGYGAITLETD
jgi:N-methylhydantoinase B